MELEDILSYLTPTPISIPKGAIDLFPKKISPKILSLPDQNRILKAGANVKMSEAEAMRYVALHTSIPVPKVHHSYVENGCGYIFMSKAEGEPLADVWGDLGEEGRDFVVSQLRNYTEQLRSLTGEFYGALWHQASEDIFFGHLPFHHVDVVYGPYCSRQQYNDGLVAALENSRPSRSPLDAFEEDLVARIQTVTDERKVFSHGDLHPSNILADRKGNVTAISDWGSAGFSICGREYYEARSRSRNDDWTVALNEIFPEEARGHFDLLEEFNLALTRYTGL